jgi:hypothetical protein
MSTLTFDFIHNLHNKTLFIYHIYHVFKVNIEMHD